MLPDNNPDNNDNQQPELADSDHSANNSFVLGKYTTFSSPGTGKSTDSNNIDNKVPVSSASTSSAKSNRSYLTADNNQVGPQRPINNNATALSNPSSKVVIQPLNRSSSSLETQPISPTDIPSSNNITSPSSMSLNEPNQSINSYQPLPSLSAEPVNQPQVFTSTTQYSAGSNADHVDPVTVASNDVTTNPAPSNQARTKKVGLGVVVGAIFGVTVIVGLIAGYLFWRSYQNSPGVVFKDALINSLSSKTIQEINSGQGITTRISISDADLQRPIMFISTNEVIEGVTLSLQAYSTPQSGYERIQANNSGSSIFNSINNKWALVKENGVDSPEIGAYSSSLVDPYLLMFGQWYTANFSASQRSDLVNYALTNNIFKYQANKVRAVTINNQKMLEYDISVKPSQLNKLDLQVSRLLNFNQNETIALTNYVLSSGLVNFKLFISLVNKQLYKAVASYGFSPDGSTSTTYVFNSKLNIPSRPTTQISAKQLSAIIMGE